jgi:hypothetical protein
MVSRQVADDLVYARDLPCPDIICPTLLLLEANEVSD